MIYMKVFWFAKDLIRIDYQGQVHDVEGAALLRDFDARTARSAIYLCAS
mgnify:FL=1